MAENTTTYQGKVDIVGEKLQRDLNSKGLSTNNVQALNAYNLKVKQANNIKILNEQLNTLKEDFLLFKREIIKHFG